MSRHRSVRGMTYDEDLDGYDDDLYGQSVEDDYGVSPATAEQFLYPGSHRGHQLSSFLENIGEEEDERGAMQEPLADSGSFKRPKLNATDEARLQSCLEEIRNIVGETVPEHVIITKVLESNFGFETALDGCLNYQENGSKRRKADKQPPIVSRNTKGARQLKGHPSHSEARSDFSLSANSHGRYVRNPSKLVQNISSGGTADKADSMSSRPRVLSGSCNSNVKIIPHSLLDQVKCVGCDPMDQIATGEINLKLGPSLSNLALSRKQTTGLEKCQSVSDQVHLTEKQKHHTSSRDVPQGISLFQQVCSSLEQSLDLLALGHEPDRVQKVPRRPWLNHAQLAQEHEQQKPNSGINRDRSGLGLGHSKPSLSSLASSHGKHQIQDKSGCSLSLAALRQGHANQEIKDKINSKVLCKDLTTSPSDHASSKTSDRPRSGLGLSDLAGRHLAQMGGAGLKGGSEAVPSSALSLDRLAPSVVKLSVKGGDKEIGAQELLPVLVGERFGKLVVESQASESTPKFDPALGECRKLRSMVKPTVGGVHPKGATPSAGLSLSDLASLHLAEGNNTLLATKQSDSVAVKPETKHDRVLVTREANLSIPKHARKKKKTGRKMNGRSNVERSTGVNVNQDIGVDSLEESTEDGLLPLQPLMHSSLEGSCLAEPSKFARSLCLMYLGPKRKRAAQGSPGSKCAKRFQFQRQASMTKYQEEVEYVHDVTPFDFTTPSPDDIVTQRQKAAFGRT